MLTRNALYSGVSILASPIKGVSEFGPQPLRVSPIKPQCSGMPTTCTILPSHINGLIRLVTTALAFTEPRLDQTRTQCPEIMFFSFASCSEISTKNSGWVTALGCTCLVQKWKCSVSCRPPPRTPMLPRMSCNMAMVRMFCEPLECCVQPSAYIDVMVLVFDEHSPIISQTLRNF